jgi:hypothetical protein
MVIARFGWGLAWELALVLVGAREPLFVTAEVVRAPAETEAVLGLMSDLFA